MNITKAMLKRFAIGTGVASIAGAGGYVGHKIGYKRGATNMANEYTKALMDEMNKTAGPTLAIAKQVGKELLRVSREKVNPHTIKKSFSHLRQSGVDLKDVYKNKRSDKVNSFVYNLGNSKLAIGMTAAGAYSAVKGSKKVFGAPEDVSYAAYPQTYFQ